MMYGTMAMPIGLISGGVDLALPTSAMIELSIIFTCPHTRAHYSGSAAEIRIYTDPTT